VTEKRASTTANPWPLRALVAANAVSLAGNTMAAVAIPWFVLESTGSAALTGVAAFAGTAPIVVGSLIAGRVVDRLGARGASVASDLVSGVAVAGVPLAQALGILELPLLLLLVAVGALVDAAGAAARQALVPGAADAAGVDLSHANARFGGTEHLGYLLGAPLAGVLLTAFGASTVLWFDAGTFAISALVVTAAVRGFATGSPSASQTASLRDAARHLFGDRALRTLFILPIVGSLLIDPLAGVVLPVYARSAGGAAAGLGVAVAAFGVGGLAGTLATPVLERRLGRIALYRIGFACWPLTYLPMAFVPAFPVGLVAVAAVGVVAGVLTPIDRTVVQERTPPDLLPRVVGLLSASVRISGPIAILATGAALQGIGLGTMFAAWTIGTALIAAWVFVDPGVARFGGPVRAGIRAASAPGRDATPVDKPKPPDVVRDELDGRG
jgi:Na+/melibiose symporter-like transporter